MKNPIIVALDVPTASEALALADRLGDSVAMYKVGLELYTAAGPALVKELLNRGGRVFLDLKLFDIPETVKRATAVVSGMGVSMLTVHAVGSVMRAAVEGRGSSELKLLAVTVLTSFSAEDLAELGFKTSITDLVVARATKAKESGMDGIVCSPLEVEAVREAMGAGAVLVTPGVRSAGADRGDQKRIATPAEAIRNGATHLVIGRQITRAADPLAEARRILSELEH